VKRGGRYDACLATVLLSGRVSGEGGKGCPVWCPACEEKPRPRKLQGKYRLNFPDLERPALDPRRQHAVPCWAPCGVPSGLSAVFLPIFRLKGSCVGSWGPAARWQMPLGMRVEKRGLEGGRVARRFTAGEEWVVPRPEGVVLDPDPGCSHGPKAWY